jgi:predicted GIY-YIG superfamily endonuclease
MVSIYILIENNIPVYLGKTNNSSRRLKEHRMNFSKDVSLEVIDEVEEKEWIFWEQWWIEMFNSWNIKLLNKNKGGGGPKYQTDLSKKLIGNKQKGIKKSTVSDKLKGQKITWDLGTSIVILQFDKSGNFIEEYKSMGEAYSKTGVPTSAICEVCKGNRRSAHGYIWLYKNKWDGNPPSLKQHKSKGKPSNNKKTKL